ncbi:MAG: SDR family oxidoreductase [Dehalococcoidales bacterium]|nr:SDR family oxidoreductase [Dehalococcoidales bacterium]
MDLGLTNKVALVTGAGSQVGFGKGTALVLASEGCHIIVNDIDLRGAEQTASEIRAMGRNALAVKADVTRQTEVDEMVGEALSRFGRIDILVNNAGGMDCPKAFIDMSDSDRERGLDLNFRAMMNCTWAVLPRMLDRKSGKIINIASDGGLKGVANGTVYCAAKAAVINFTQSLAREVIGSGINVNSIAPGLGNTNFFRDFPSQVVEMAGKMADEKKATTPRDIGNTVAFLASDVSIHIIGQCILVSGML